MSAWEFRRVSGTVAELHQQSALLVAGPVAGRQVRAYVPTDRALVLGSGQPAEHADSAACAAQEVQVVRRRSGGGAVLVEATGMVWVDLAVPADDPLWRPDVSQSAGWAGEAWARALAGAGLSDLQVWPGPMLRREWSSVVCFAGLAAGEVTRPGGEPGAKIVGISQRRTRYGAIFQCACLLRWEPATLVGLLSLDDAQKQRATVDLAALAFGAGQDKGDEIAANLLAVLP